MIAEMKQVSMVVQTKDKELTLDALAELGLVHLEDFQYSSSEVDDALARKNRAETAYNFLISLKSKNDLTPPSLKPSEAVEEVLKLKDDLQAAMEQEAALEKQIAGLENWGDFDPADFAFLASKGYHLKIYIVSGGKIDNIDDLGGYVVILREDKKELVFAHLTREPVKLDDYEEFNLPPQSLSAMRAEKNKLETKIEELTGKAQHYFSLGPALHAHLEELDSNLQYWIAKANTVDEGNLTAIVGYLPADETEAVQNWARQNSVALAITEPEFIRIRTNADP
jgi:V/A-type H+/Na+-transporting ATPase subunit I